MLMELDEMINLHYLYTRDILHPNRFLKAANDRDILSAPQRIVEYTITILNNRPLKRVMYVCMYVFMYFPFECCIEVEWSYTTPIVIALNVN